MINFRDQIPNLLPEKSIGCELGVFEGDFSEILISSNKFDKLYLVDIFSGPASNFGKHYGDARILYDKVNQKFASNNQIEVIKQDSVDFLNNCNIKFDFIYIDTVHSYSHLARELMAAHQCIKHKGYICGHDYCAEFSGVVEAVREFSIKYDYKVISTIENDYPSFIIQIT